MAVERALQKLVQDALDLHGLHDSFGATILVQKLLHVLIEVLKDEPETILSAGAVHDLL